MRLCDAWVPFGGRRTSATKRVRFEAGACKDAPSRLGWLEALPFSRLDEFLYLAGDALGMSDGGQMSAVRQPHLPRPGDAGFQIAQAPLGNEHVAISG